MMEYKCCDRRHRCCHHNHKSHPMPPAHKCMQYKNTNTTISPPFVADRHRIIIYTRTETWLFQITTTLIINHSILFLFVCWKRFCSKRRHCNSSLLWRIRFSFRFPFAHHSFTFLPYTSFGASKRKKKNLRGSASIHVSESVALKFLWVFTETETICICAHTHQHIKTKFLFSSPAGRSQTFILFVDKQHSMECKISSSHKCIDCRERERESNVPAPRHRRNKHSSQDAIAHNWVVTFDDKKNGEKKEHETDIREITALTLDTASQSSQMEFFTKWKRKKRREQHFPLRLFFVFFTHNDSL